MSLPVAWDVKPIIGFRWWDIHEDPDLGLLRLVSPMTKVVWAVKRPARAFNVSFEAWHAAGLTPRATCPCEEFECGLYALSLSAAHTTSWAYKPRWYPYREYRTLRRGFPGLVALWGKIIRGDNGVLRAEFAYPVCVFEPMHFDLQPISDTAARALVTARDWIQRVAVQYGVPTRPAPDHVQELPRVAESVAAEIFRGFRGAS